ncbi:MAG: translation initiation factor IF-2 subunit alpha [Methanobacteriota archaeon]|nr:MAG: translation initiation factor IF-2 subunit alpha [Euryarchaeota archaeon]
MSPQDTPEEGEYVIGRVIEVKDFGATLKLLEFSERKAFVHISEVASGWVKYIRDFIREGQRVVAKVTKVKEGSKICDASVRQVSGHRKQEKIRDWKNEQRASKLLELVAIKSKMEPEELSNKVRNDLTKMYGNLYSGFEASVMDEPSFKNEWKGQWVENFIDAARANVTPPYVSIGGKFDLVSYDAKGIEKIKKALVTPSAINKDTTLKIASNGSPSYRISVKAPNYKQAEDELKIAVDSVLKTLKAEGGIGSFERS